MDIEITDIDTSHWIALDGRIVRKPTFERFFTHDELMGIAEKAKSNECWDYASMLGTTVKEKYESICIRIMELNNVLIRRGAAGVFWLATSHEVATIFETATSSSFYDPPGDRLTDMAQGIQRVRYVTDVCNRWRLYKDDQMPLDMIVIGVNDTREDDAHYSVMRIKNLGI